MLSKRREPLLTLTDHNASHCAPGTKEVRVIKAALLAITPDQVAAHDLCGGLAEGEKLFKRSCPDDLRNAPYQVYL